MALRLLMLLLGPACTAIQEPVSAPPARPVPVVFPAGYSNYEALTAALQAATQRNPNLVRLRALGKSVEGRNVWLVSIGRAEGEAGPRRPAVLIVANLEADHLVGSQLALGLLDRLAAADQDPEVAAILDRAVVYLVPRLNPDGAERMIASRPGLDHRLSLRPLDRDRDGKQGEDGPDDLDGDGWALTMRVRDLKSTWIADSTDGRLARKADPGHGEQAQFSLYREGRDDDGDGTLNEDPPGGVNLNRNWPHRWPEFDPEAGWSPGLEPETRPLIRFVTDHPEIAVVWTLSLNDSLTAEPKKPGSTLDDADLPLFVELSKRYNQALSEAAKAAPAIVPMRAATPLVAPAEPLPLRPVTPSAIAADLPLETASDGSLSEWAYHQLGLIAFATRVWSGPEIPEPPEGQPKPPTEPEPRWLYWNDQVVGGIAFVPFHRAEHPTLGTVQVGGWKPGVRVNPPADRLPHLVAGHGAFLKDLVGLLPTLEWGDVKVENRGDGLFEISAVLTNSGFLPTLSQQAIHTGESFPVVVRLTAPRGLLLSGKPQVKIDRLNGAGGTHLLKWLIQAPAELQAVEIEAVTPRAGLVRRTVPLR